MQIAQQVIQGMRPVVPEGTHPLVAQLISDCTEFDPEIRPSSKDICDRIEELHDDKEKT